MAAQHQSIMRHVLAFLEKAAEDEWGMDFTIEQWQVKENEDAIKEIIKPTTKTSTKLKDPNKPKRGKTAYMLFCADERPGVKAELVDVKPTGVTAELGRRWNTFKESTKPSDKRRYKKYVDAAAVDKQRYDDEMAEYVAPSGAELELIAANKPKRGRKTTKTTDEDAKPKRGKSSYLYFCAANREAVKTENPEMAAKDVMAELGRLWRELKVDDEREDEYEKYQRLAAADKERYEAEMAALEPTEAPKAKKPKKAPSDDDSSDDEPVKEEPIKKRNTYHLFCDDHHSKVTEENPEMTKADVRKQLTAMWKELSKEEKETYKK